MSAGCGGNNDMATDASDGSTMDWHMGHGKKDLETFVIPLSRT